MAHLLPTRDRTDAPATTRARLRIIALIDCETSADAFMRWLDERRGESPDTVVLLAVLPKPDEVRSRGILSGKVRAILIERGHRRVEDLARHLEAAGLAHEERVEIADEAEAVVRIAREKRADLIVLVARPVGSMRRCLSELGILGAHGTVARVADLAAAPVLVLRRGVH